MLGPILSRYSKRLLVCASSLLLATCAPKKPVYPTIYIDPACVTEAIQLINCDKQDPPHCEKSRIVYTKGCERVSVK